MIRPAQPDDIPRLMELEREASTAAHWTEANYRAIFEPDSLRFALVVADGAAPHSISGYIVVRAFGDVWEIENVVVSKSQRRRGLASQLLSAVLDEAREQGAAALELEVRCTNSGAIALYSGFGFRQVGTRKAYYSNPLEGAALLRLDFAGAARENG